MFAAIYVLTGKMARICLICPMNDIYINFFAGFSEIKWNHLVLVFQEPRKWWLM